MADISELESKFLKADSLAQSGDEQAKSDAALFAAEIKRARSNQSTKGLREFQSNNGGAAFGNPILRSGANREGKMTDIGYVMGGHAQDALLKAGVSPDTADTAGQVVNLGLNTIPALVGGGFGGSAGMAAAPIVESASRSLMRSALKPIATIDPMRVERAITAMHDNGANVNVSGISKLLSKEADLGAQEAALVAPSNKAIDVNSVAAKLDSYASKVDVPGIPRSEVATVNRIKEEFLTHPNLKTRSAMEAILEKQIAEKEASRIAAMHDAGRFKTFEAQQGNLANGGGIQLSPAQKLNEPYMNVGVTGDRALSPSAYPVMPETRIPGRYTENMQRVPEGKSASEVATKIAEQRRMEADFLKYQLQSLRAHQEAGMTVQDAQKSKQAIYQYLGDRAYTGELKKTETEASKAVASSLREHLEKAIPEVGPINKERSALIDAIKIATRREAVEGNKNPFGLSMLAHSPQVALAMMADRSATFRSALSNFLHSHYSTIPTTLGALTGAAAGAAVGYGNLSDLQK